MKRRAICTGKLLLFLLTLSGFLPYLTGNLPANRSFLVESSEIYSAAQTLFDSKKYVEAVPLYREVIIHHHDVSAKAYLMIGRCYFELKDYTQARKWFEELVASFPQDAETMHVELKKYWGASFFHENMWAEALARFTGKGIPGANAIPPMEQPWYDMVGRCYEQLGDMEKSLEVHNPHFYTDLAPIPKENASFIRAHYWQIADTKEGLRDLALYRIAESYLHENRYEDAIHVLQVVDANFYKDAALLIGRSYFEWGKYIQAAEWLEECVNRYAHSAPVFYYYLGLSYYYQHNYEATLKNLAQIEHLFPDTMIPIECQYRIADSLFALERYSEAFKEYDKITGLYTPSSRVIQASYRMEICNANK